VIIKKIFFTLTIILLACSGLWAQIDFFKEDLQFELNENFFTVTGDYYFRNTSDHDIKATLFYPGNIILPDPAGQHTWFL